MRVDVHCHIGLPHLSPLPDDRFSFEPAGEYASHDAYFSPRLAGSAGMWIGGRQFGVDPADDAALEQHLLKEILGADSVDRVVLLAFDQYHTSEGRAVGPRPNRRSVGSDLYVSNTYVRSLARRYPQRILFGASIHPYRRGAIDMLDEVAGKGAVLIKWLPPAQNIDPADPRTIAFLRHAATLGIAMLIHQGGELSLGNIHPDQGHPDGLLSTLRALRAEAAMPTVIVAHAATPATWFGSTRGYRALTAALLGDFADAPLYADVSALALFSKGRWLKRLARRPELHGKLVYGSDFPVPPTLSYFRRQLGREYHQIRGLRYEIDRDVAIKRSLGLQDGVFTRAATILRIPHDGEELSEPSPPV